ncbi:DNA replication protein DnaC [Amycolatopsis arida]|uniref:DNA replication protein DnaC n=1 Tax=Amycolatopsis arida TaxID=587909 RepID=A0A1I6ALR8_9PSEU|nr:ATP-binding protein [Amycolatopsis arida]TDX87386.1 DNA replication protein DnaC [Amycolatopsis arida]SFQ69634.1 DNA replication protein DnaC [Amycolatopsis arida]
MTTTLPAGQTAPGVDGLDAMLDQACRTLALPTIRDRYAEIAESSMRQQASYRTFLLELLEAEVDHRDERRRTRLVREAKFRRSKRIEDFDFSANPNVTPRDHHHTHRTCLGRRRAAALPDRRLRHRQTHLLVRIGTAIAEAGLKVRYITTANSVNELSEAADEKQLTKVYARYDRVDLLCLDEFGYLELDKAGARLLFQLFTDRDERRAIAIATNAPFSEWPKTFTDQRFSRAIVDWMTFKANIIETGSQSYRVHGTQARLRDQA